MQARALNCQHGTRYELLEVPPIFLCYIEYIEEPVEQQEYHKCALLALLIIKWTQSILQAFLNSRI